PRSLFFPYSVRPPHLTSFPTRRSSDLPLPNPYVVPGGRFREVYYWDSYFTMLGLIESGRTDLVKSMLDNFAHLIVTVGHIVVERSEEHTSELQSRGHLVCRLLLEKKK